MIWAVKVRLNGHLANIYNAWRIREEERPFIPRKEMAAKTELEKLEKDRLESLFSIYNSENVAASLEKLQFWRKIINLELGNSFVLNPFQLDQKFIVNGLFPLCLNEILSEMVKEGDLLIKEKKSLIKSILSYLSAPTELTKSTELLISKSILEKFRTAVLTALPRDEPIDADQLSEILTSTGLVKSDYEYLIANLISTKNLNTLHNNHITIYSSNPVTLSEEDLGKCILKRSIRSLYSQTNLLEGKIVNLKESIKKALFEKQKPRALTFLKQLKLVEKQAESNQEKILNMESLLQGIISAQDNVELLKTYQMGSSVLKKVLGKKELADAQETMDDVYDTLDELRQVEDIIYADRDASLDEGVLEEELEKLIADESNVEDLAKQLDALKTVETPLPEQVKKVADAGNENVLLPV